MPLMVTERVKKRRRKKLMPPPKLPNLLPPKIRLNHQ